ncbi:MAG TPA: peptidoglycan DD-metalloendopeptidase family protein [Kiritimatiellia bacterium]|nr:peptidoglycan DD-metalloendopeptidase family protein [Kiritimatiellia bacterium]HRZ13713.1 peptidoglycan DD-metalloendopeptidase family protein [Kiritimatiellia bacterium]HSA19379.1 peptidoglycan DD-metalloendopeptidase family protein [Kiritimatiellia bacterium]
MLFPSLAGHPVARINLDDEAARWLARRAAAPGAPNPLLDPSVCGRMLDEVHRRERVAWSYGGYLEDRRRLWRGSYLEKAGAFIHLGVDFNVPRGTEFVAGFPAGIVVVDDDQDRDGGWGKRIILRPEIPGCDALLIYAHLQNVRRRPGEHAPAGAVLAEVGGPPDNGNWHPHLHIQAIRRGLFEEILLDRFNELDGYGRAEELDALRASFPDPLPIVRP